MGSANHFLYQKLLLFFTTFCFSVLLPLFGFITTYIFRFKRKDICVKTNSNYSLVTSEVDNQDGSNCTFPETESSKPELEAKRDVLDFSDSETDGFVEKEKPNFSFSFKFPTFEEFSRNNGGNLSSLISEEEVPTTSTNKYEFMSVKGFSGVIKEPEILSFTVKELNTGTNGGFLGDKDSVHDGDFSVNDFTQLNSDAEGVHEELPRNSINGVCSEEKIEAMTVKEEKEEELNAESELQGDDDLSDELQFHSEKNSIATNSDSDSVGLNHLHLIMSRFVDSCSDGFLSDGDFGGEFELDDLMGMDGEKLESHEEFSASSRHESDDSDEEDSDIREELRQLEEANLEYSEKFNSEFLSEKDFHEDLDKSKNEKSEEPNSKSLSALDSEDSNKLETLWEHQELIEQLKMELKKVRATGLPTILEESESPKIMEDLKPWKIDEKFQHEDPMDELHKFYKSYRERMRKFDILNYQKMYAIGFLQLKDPLQSISREKSAASSITLTTLFSQNSSQCKRKKSETDPTTNFIRELRSDLEVVYVGQMCLSWEILHWQYGKALELWESDPRGIRLYNEVAGEFQQYQVLTQRFIEDEPFQGPRVQNYVKSRCVLRNLLQVPVIREDSSKDRKKARRREGGEYAITNDLLLEIMEESIRIFWRFVKADKDCTNVIRRAVEVELQDPADTEILMEVRKNLQKKEKKLKDLLRSGNCILRKFRKCQEDESDHVLYFFSQVDMKLVTRVLNMSRITTEQLVWCRNKLNKISFVSRKIQVEPSFLLFPC
ncbi:uncharacterized protein LOC132285233 [Cornus florida]|uniref:uncharacterized protein LOC132285233 n=1 Tax=Cornus florida TaxID=4283 RepID=UPI0028A19C52|nr:uncharacterized protein LOC132285233 [Cornus florida]XP_059643387.1 uncharacterized protein LOC132285233 [Cornus florida]